MIIKKKSEAFIKKIEPSIIIKKKRIISLYILHVFMCVFVYINV